MWVQGPVSVGEATCVLDKRFRPQLRATARWWPKEVTQAPGRPPVAVGWPASSGQDTSAAGLVHSCDVFSQ